MASNGTHWQLVLLLTREYAKCNERGIVNSGKYGHLHSIYHYNEKSYRISRKLERYNSFIIQHIDNKTNFEEKKWSTSFLFSHSLVKMLKFTYIVGYTSCGPTCIESFFAIFGQCINVLNYKNCYSKHR